MREGAQKETVSKEVGDFLERFFPGGLSKIGEFLIDNSFSVEKAISYFTVTGVSKQVLLFVLIIFYYISFLTAYAIVFFNTIVTGSWINCRLSSCCLLSYYTLDSR